MKRILKIFIVLIIAVPLTADDAINVDEAGNVVMNNLVKIQYDKDGKGSASLTLQDLLRQLTPPGSIQPYGGTTAPDGWLLCNGDPVSQDDYPDLFDVIGTSFGDGSDGDGDDNFNLPDLRGMFLRGVDNGTGNDADAASRTKMNDDQVVLGDVVGSYQKDAIRNITGYARVSTRSRGAVPPFSYGTNYGDAFDSSSANGYDSLLHFNASTVVPTGEDNRPKNISVNYIIKY